MLPAGSLSNFAVRDLALPCSINGISPDILFQFNAKVNLINPELTTDCGIITQTGRIIAGNHQQCTGQQLQVSPYVNRIRGAGGSMCRPSGEPCSA
jgi:hypothetical protein